MSDPPPDSYGVKREQYRYSLDPQTERVFLQELASVLDIALWRASEIEECIVEIRQEGRVASRPLACPYFGSRAVSGETRLYGAIEAFLAAWARASLILSPSGDRGRYRRRGKHLCAVLGIREASLHTRPGDRSLRDGWMHLDEDLDDWAKQRDGQVAASSIGGPEETWHHLALGGSIRIVDVDHVSVALPLRGHWSLRPYFHRCRDLRADVARAIESAPYRWHRHDGVCGIVAAWIGQEPLWMMKALSLPEPFTVTAPSRPELLHAFAEAVSRWRTANPRE